MNFTLQNVEQGLKLFEIEIDPHILHDGEIIQAAFRRKLTTQEGKQIVPDLIAARSILLLQIIQNCTEIGCDPKYPILDIEYQCKCCRGIGAIPFMEVVYIPNCKKCDSCQGSGIKTEECKPCGGTGKKGRDICGLCRGSGKYEYKRTKTRKEATECPTCSGTKYIGSYKTTGKIIGSQLCPNCMGKGQLIKK